jgi:predicted dehydrogenase
MAIFCASKHKTSRQAGEWSDIIWADRIIRTHSAEPLGNTTLKMGNIEETAMSSSIHRRDFIKHGIATGATLAASRTRILGANDRIRIALIGAGRQGRGVMRGFTQQEDVQIVAVSDVYEPHTNLAVTEAKLQNVQKQKDFRKILDDKSIDAVIIGSPDHWHAQMTVMACQAGKDVYVEKPISTTIEEGRKMVQAARKYNRIVQVGTQQRSGDHYQKAAELIRSGALGKVGFIRTWNYGNAGIDGIGAPADSNPPDGLDWDLWLGPAPARPFNANRWGVHPDRWSSFRWFWDYAGGMMTDWGVHHLDIVQMIMQVDAPTAVSASGGKFALRDNRETPDTLQVTYEYSSERNGNFLCTYENRECNALPLNGQGYGMMFHGSEGTLFLNRDRYEIYKEFAKAETAPTIVKSANNQSRAHHLDFLIRIKSRKLPIADIEIGHRSTSTCLLGNIALRTGHKIFWDAKAEKIIGDDEASKYLTREYREPWKLEV